MNHVSIISFHDEQEDDTMLREVRDYTSRIDFNNDVTYDNTTPIVHHATRR